MLSDLAYRLRAIFRRRRMESELSEELQFHFERQVEVFIGDIELEASSRDFTFDTLESANDCTQLARLEQSSLLEHPRMRDRPANIVPKKPPVEGQRRGEGFDLGDAAARESSPDEIARCGAGRHSLNLLFLAATHFHSFNPKRS